MKLIAILLGLLAEHFIGQLHQLRRYDLFERYVRRFRGFCSGGIWDSHAGIVVILLPFIIVVTWLQLWFNDSLFGLPGLLFSVVVLVYCLGPYDLGDDVEQYRDAIQKDDTGLAFHLADEFLRIDPPEDPEQQAASFVRGIFAEAHTRLFGTLFWFILLGPVGAVLFRGARLLTLGDEESDERFIDSANRIMYLISWPSTRLVALGYGLSGHFEAAVDRWRQYSEGAGHLEKDPESLLVAVGIGALGVDEDTPESVDWYEMLHSAMRLVRRTLIVWVFVVALLTLAGWAS
jgi:AmpE protein